MWQTIKKILNYEFPKSETHLLMEEYQTATPQEAKIITKKLIPLVLLGVLPFLAVIATALLSGNLRRIIAIIFSIFFIFTPILALMILQQWIVSKKISQAKGAIIVVFAILVLIIGLRFTFDLVRTLLSQ